MINTLKDTSAGARLDKWRELEISRQTRMNEKKYKVQIFYERTLPSGIDLSKASLVERTYVSNPKLGKVYELRQEIAPKTRHAKAEKSPTRVQENNIWLWNHEDQLVNHLQSRGHKTVKPRDGLRLSGFQRAREASTHAPINSSQHTSTKLRSLPTSEDLRQWSPITAERFRQRSMSHSGGITGSFESTDSLDEGVGFRGRSQSLSDYSVYRRPILTTSTFNRPASDSNRSDPIEKSRTSPVDGNTEACGVKNGSKTAKPSDVECPASQRWFQKSTTHLCKRSQMKYAACCDP